MPLGPVSAPSAVFAGWERAVPEAARTMPALTARSCLRMDPVLLCRKAFERINTGGGPFIPYGRKNRRRASAMAAFHRPLDFALALPLLDRGALVVLGLSLGQRDLALDLPILPVQVERDQRIAFLLDLSDQAADLILVHQQLLGPYGIGADMGGRGLQRIDLAADHVQLAALDDHIAVGQLRLALAQGFDFPALQHHAGLEFLLEEVVVGRLLVVGNAAGCRGILRHGLQMGCRRLPTMPGGRSILYENSPQVRPHL